MVLIGLEWETWSERENKLFKFQGENKILCTQSNEQKMNNFIDYRGNCKLILTEGNLKFVVVFLSSHKNQKT